MLERAAKRFSFVRNFRFIATISVILCAIGLGGLALQAFGIPAFNMGLDFMGGATMEIELGIEVTRDVQERVEAIFDEAAGVSAGVTTSGNSGTAVIAKTGEISSEVREEIFGRIAAEYPGASLISADYVSASVGNDLKRSAFLATGLAALLILVYITFRFELRSGIAAIVCLVHDVLVMLAFFVMLRIQMNMTFIAAALTIIGYSINATIVVFDRIRENVKRQGEGDFAAVVDSSIWQTMRRSIGTTITTLLPVIFIIILGVSSIRTFAIPLLVGIIAGGYSSTCLAGPLWNLLKGKHALSK